MGDRGEADREEGRAALVLALLLAVAQATLLLGTAWDKSDTADETRYLASGATIWATGAHRDLCEAPVLPKLAFALALRAISPEVARAPDAWQESSLLLFGAASPEKMRRTFFVARCATILVTVLGGLCLWRVGTRFGRDAGLAALALWVFSPTVLANGSLAALDAWAAAGTCAVAWTAVRVRERASLGRAAALGVACGALAATKVPSLLVVPVALVVAFVPGAIASGAPPERGRAVSRLAVVAAVAVATLWALYGFRVGGVDTSDPCPFRAGPTPEGAWPFPAWWEGLAFQLRHAAEGHANYLFGETGSDGWWSFYVVALAVKTTIAVQVLVVLRIAAAGRLLGRGEAVGLRTDAALLAFPAALFVLLSAGRHQPNVGFLLPAFPWAILWLARGLPLTARAFGRGGRLLFVVLLGLAGLESLRLHPHHLMFFNAWAGGPDGGPRILIHREDWGQDKRRLAAWQRERGVERLRYAPYGPHPERWGLVWDEVPCEPVTGVFALHAVEVHRPLFALSPGCADWLTVEPPDERIGHSIYVWEVDAARLERLARKRREGAPPFWSSAPTPGAASP